MTLLLRAIFRDIPADREKIVSNSVQTSRFEPTDAMPEMTLARPDQPSAMANLVALDQGLYALEIGASPCLLGQVSSLQVPAVHVSALWNERERNAEIIGISGRGGSWLDREGGTVIVKSPPGGAHVLVTAYGLPAQAVSVPGIHVRRLDRARANGAAPRSPDPAGYPADEPEEIGSEIVLHVERLGDRRFPGEGWVGNRGKKLRIEAFSIRPIDTLLARDIEFKALGPKGRQTPWVTDAKLCGTRGQGLPLTGFAIRLAPHVAERFDVVYQGAFFESGVAGPHRNGELCIPPITDDPLEAINVRLIRRSHR
jgi:Clostridial hydrophobic W